MLLSLHLGVQLPKSIQVKEKSFFVYRIPWLQRADWNCRKAIMELSRFVLRSPGA